MKRFLTVVVLCGLFLWGSPAVWADDKEPDTRELTIEQAVDLAVKNSTKIVNGKYAIDAAYEKRQLASASALGGVRVDPDEDIKALRFLATLQQEDFNWKSARKNYTLLEDSVEYAAHQAYNGVLQALARVGLSEKEMKNAETQRVVAQARYNAGMIQQLAMEQAEASVISTKSSYEDALKALDNAYLNFNYLVGLWPQDRPVLTESPDFTKLEVVDLSSYIERNLIENPILWQKENNIDLAKTALDTYVPNSASDSYTIREITLDQRKIEASDAKEQARNALRTLYNNICQMEEQYPAVEQSIHVAEENLRVTNLMYETGTATRAEVIAAETALVQAEKSMIDLVCQHDVQKLAFAKPWAYGM